PFEDRVAFDFAQYHYVELQSSEGEIAKGLDLLCAMGIKYGSRDGLPWKSAKDLYATIDSIQSGTAPWKTYKFRYTGPKPSTPPRWMEEEYELNLRDILKVFEEELMSSEFKDDCDYAPYLEFDPQGDRVWSNLMSGDWAYRQAVISCTFLHYCDALAKNSANHGAMLVPVIAGSDKTTVSIATGHQEYHPVYASSGIISNTARRGHGNGVVPFAFLPIPKASKSQRKKPAYQKFCRQLYHKCLEFAFTPLKPYMESPKVLKCPDGHFRRAIFSLGPYIADYPEQVWLSGTVQDWCPKCDAEPNNLDAPCSHRRTHEKTDYLIKNFDPGILWDEYGIRADIVPFTHGFPRADIHELLSPDLLHQLIKGVFKDHLVTWVNEYLHHTYGEARALEIIEDIDHRQVNKLSRNIQLPNDISAVPPFPGLRRFPDGRDFTQWTGDDSKALMKVYLAAIAGYVPSAMVQCLSMFMEACYIARQNTISAPMLDKFKDCVDKFHELREIFIALGVRSSVSLPRQHALAHYYFSIQLFGSPNGLCSSITESKHIKAVKEPWRRSSRYKALSQMLTTLARMEKMSTLLRKFTELGMMAGTTSSYMASIVFKDEFVGDEKTTAHADENDEDSDAVAGTPPTPSFTDIKLSSRTQYEYPHELYNLSNHINQPEFPLAFRRFLYETHHPDSQFQPDERDCPQFEGRIHVHHSAVATFVAPSDLCGTGGLHRERIRSSPCFFGHPRRDTVFVVLDEEKRGMAGMVIARVLLFFSFNYRRRDYSCALVNWFVTTDEKPDEDTGMWTVQLEHDELGERPTFQVINIDSIARGAHLLPVYGSSRVPEDFIHHDALDSFQSFFVNRFVDHHTFEFLIDSI
ncbi:hypothetical protein GALMADRAFT_58542, partial [Galerina marginata CBS 339.88]